MENNALQYSIRPEDLGCTLGTILRKQLGLSRRLLNTLKAQDLIRQNGEVGYLNGFPRLDDRIQVFLPMDQENIVMPEPMPLEVLFENNDYLAVNKPAGMTIHPVKSYQSGTLANGVCAYFLAQGLQARFRPAGRLDRDTSGIVLVCKSRYAQNAFQAQQRNRTVCKSYLALTEGTIASNQGVIEAPIGPIRPRSIVRIVTPDGRPALSRYQVLRRKDGMTLVRLVLDTGRTHQIRVHMAHIGHPLLGDDLYGGTERMILRQALHAARLSFPDPRTGQTIRIFAPLPPDMARLLLAANTPHPSVGPCR